MSLSLSLSLSDSVINPSCKLLQECIKVCKFASMQVCKCASMQVCKYASMQACKYASMQVCKYASMLLLAKCYFISDEFYLKLVITCKNLFPFAPVVRLVIFSMLPELGTPQSQSVKNHCRSDIFIVT